MALALVACSAAPPIPRGVEGWRSFEIRVKNPTDREFAHYPLAIPLARIREAHPGFNPDGYRVFLSTIAELSSQVDDLDLDGTPDELAMEVHLPPHGEKTYTVYTDPKTFSRGVYRKRAHATVRTEFEGPGWESDLIAYRSYMDERAPVDIYAKPEPAGSPANPTLSLDVFAAKGHDSYHTPNPWGVDVLKVGDSLGCGGFALWHEGKLLRAWNPPVPDQRPYKWAVRRYAHVVADGPERAILRFSHDQWKVGPDSVTAVVDYEIWGDKRWTKCTLRVLKATPPTVAATGVVKKPGLPAVKRDTYLYTFGPQSEILDEATQKPEMLGMAVLFRRQDFLAWEDAALSHSTPETEPLTHVVTLSMGDAHAVTWWLLAGWGRGSLGFRTAEAFEKHLQDVAAEIAFQPEVTIR